eukprot:9477446-Pyramimonas_sp.AAC.1
MRGLAPRLWVDTNQVPAHQPPPRRVNIAHRIIVAGERRLTAALERLGKCRGRVVEHGPRCRDISEQLFRTTQSAT